MAVETIVKIIFLVASFVITTAVPFIISLVNANKKRKEAKTEAEKQAAINEMTEAAKVFIVQAEQLYKEYDALMKANGSTGGLVKKDSVMSKLQAYALEKGYTFDAEYWSNKIDSIVELTRKVNAKK